MSAEERERGRKALRRLYESESKRRAKRAERDLEMAPYIRGYH